MMKDPDIPTGILTARDTSPQYLREIQKAYPGASLDDLILAASLRQARASMGIEHAPQIRLPVRSEGIIFDRHFRFKDCPPGAQFALEYQRGGEQVGNIYTGYTDVVRVFALYDDAHNPLASFVLRDSDSDDMTTPGEIQCLPHEDAITASGYRLLHDIPARDLEEYLREFPTFFSDGGEFQTKTSIDMTGEKIPLEFGVRFVTYCKSLESDPAHREELFLFVRENILGGLDALSVIENQEELIQLLDANRASRDPIQFSLFLKGFASIRSAIEIADVYSDVGPIASMLGAISKRYFFGVLRSMDQGYVDWTMVDNSLHAFNDLINGVYQLPMPRELEEQTSFRGAFTNFVLAHAHDPDALGVIEPVIVELWLDELARVKEGQGGGPGDRDVSRQHFYETLGIHLEEKASETTGDTPQELDRFEGIFAWLAGEGKLSSGYRMLDVGSRSGNRILRPLLKRLDGAGIAPGSVVASDADSYAEPADGAWKFVQADFTHDGFPEEVGAPFHLITHTWSPINDVLEGWRQQTALNNFSRSLVPGGYMVMDIPIGYEEEKLRYVLEHGGSLGLINKEFNVEDGGTVSKPFNINELYDITLRFARAGLRIVNLPGSGRAPEDVPALWTTKQRNERVTLILEKFGDPDEAIDVVLAGRSS